MRSRIEDQNDGTFKVILDYRKNGQGKRRVRRVNGSKRTAEQVLQQMIVEFGLEAPESVPDLTVAQYLSQWYETVCVPRREATTAAGYMYAFRKHIAPAVGSIKLTDLEPLHVQRMCSDMTARGYKPRTVQWARNALHTALQQAVEWDMLPKNPVTAVKAPRPPRKQIKVVTPEALANFLEASRRRPIWPIVELALYTGMRRGELLGLKWADVDFEARVIRLRHNRVRVDGKDIIKTPKTRRGQREIALPDQAAEMLRGLKALAENEMVFPHLPPTTLDYQFRQLRKEAGLPELRLHDLRHTHASLLLMANVNPKVVQERLGHESISTTLDIYGHLIPGMQREAAAAMDKVIVEANKAVGTNLAPAAPQTRRKTPALKPRKRKPRG